MHFFLKFFVLQICITVLHFTVEKSKKLNKQLFPFQELEEQLAEQKKLLQSVASRGEEILIQQASPTVTRYFSYI